MVVFTSSLASTPPCFNMFRIAVFQSLGVSAFRSLSRLTSSNKVSAAPAARPIIKACASVAPRSFASTMPDVAAEPPSSSVAPGTPISVSPVTPKLSAMDISRLYPPEYRFPTMVSLPAFPAVAASILSLTPVRMALETPYGSMLSVL